MQEMQEMEEVVALEEMVLEINLGQEQVVLEMTIQGQVVGQEHMELIWLLTEVVLELLL